MISINKQGNAIVIEFTDNDKYLFNGKIEVAPNELIVVTDDSEMATFKKASNGDVLFSQLISDIQIAGSPVTKDTIIDQFATIGFISGEGYATKEELADKQDTLVSGTTIKTINGNSILGEGNIEITGGTVDTTMSDTSENAVQNKVIKAYVDGLVGDINSVLTRING